MFGSNENEDEIEHPALAKFSPTVETIKHVARKALKWAVVGGLIGGIALALIPGGAAVIGGGLASVVGWNSATGFLASGVVKSFITGALTVGGISAAVGAVSGLASADDAMEDRKEQVIAAYERAEERALKMSAIEARQENVRQQLAARAQTIGISPGQGLPMLNPNEHGLG